MATNRTIDELLAMFRDGLPPKTITPVYFQDMISSLHPMSGTFTGMPATPGSLAAGRLWLNNDTVQLAQGAGATSLLGSFRGSGAASFSVAAPRQRMLGRTQYPGLAGFTANATVTTPGASTTFNDDFNSFNTLKWYADSYDEGGGAFWSNNPTDVADVFTFTGGKLHFAILNRSSGGKSFTSGIANTFNPQFTGGSAFQQQYGYWEISVAVDRYPGLLYELDVLSALNWPPALCPVRIWTDASNVQSVIQFLYDAPPIVGTDSNSGWDASVSHAYGMEWTASAIRFYRDRVLVGSFGNPGGPYTNGDPCFMKHYCQTDFSSVAGVTVNGAGLPKYAHVDSINVWAARPF